jgi:hypothetical protein
VESWRNIHQDWEYWLWQEQDIDLLVQKIYPWFQEAFELSSDKMRRDVSMFLVLHTFGGIYAEMDVELLRNLNPLLNGRTCILAQEPPEHAFFIHNKDNFVSDAVMASAPRHTFFSWFIQRLPKKPKHEIVVGDKNEPLLDSSLGQYIKELKNGYIVVKDPKTAEVYVASPNQLMPHFDESDDFKMAIVSKCNSDRESSLHFNSLCKDLKKRGYKNTREIVDSITTHHWIKYSSDTNLDENETVDIGDIVPNVNVTVMILEEFYTWKKVL